VLAFFTGFTSLWGNNPEKQAIKSKISNIAQKLGGKIAVKRNLLTKEERIFYVDANGFDFSFSTLNGTAGLFINSLVIHNKEGADVEKPTPYMLRKVRELLDAAKEFKLTPQEFHKIAKPSFSN
jgi:hypothetical protein